MKLIIDIDDKDYEKLKDGHIPFRILDVMQNGTPIPDNATNGDIIMTMFPSKFQSKRYPNDNEVFYDGMDYIKSFRLDWWDAQYKKVRADKR